MDLWSVGVMSDSQRRTACTNFFGGHALGKVEGCGGAATWNRPQDISTSKRIDGRLEICEL